MPTSNIYIYIYIYKNYTFLPVYHPFPPFFQLFLRYPLEGEPRVSDLYQMSTHVHDEISVMESSKK